MKVREVERFEGLVEGRCDRFRVRVRARDVVVGEVVKQACRVPIVPFRHYRYVTNERMIERLRD